MGFINWVLDLRKKLDMPHKLSEVIEEKDLQIRSIIKNGFRRSHQQEEIQKN